MHKEETKARDQEHKQDWIVSCQNRRLQMKTVTEALNLKFSPTDQYLT